MDLLFAREDLKEVVLLGARDEIFVLLEDKLRQKGIRYLHLDTVERINKGSMVLTWQPEYVEAIMDSKGIEFVNLLGAAELQVERGK